ncbi:MAG: winged helix-turn-helix transcriptional regulator [Thiothrix sp.]|uniref:winged helix-turn-helix transcriptional regulator n=1 Tax=Thiothrix sp. TaxID=1032 RepID=UPI0026244DC6|nr:winged helix-turn-helix transcriptional regulator [Thiothrix sp.]MDD5394420.1 winged helix-turn-helix transcriptional regulator [Thiothrix sp.]
MTEPSRIEYKQAAILKKPSRKILMPMLDNPEITIPELAATIGITERSIERNIQNLQKENKIQRVGSAKGGCWEVLDYEK